MGISLICPSCGHVFKALNLAALPEVIIYYMNHAVEQHWDMLRKHREILDALGKN